MYGRRLVKDTLIVALRRGERKNQPMLLLGATLILSEEQRSKDTTRFHLGNEP